MTTAKAEALAKILLIQSFVGHMPDESGILSFVCRGLKDLPGVLDARAISAETSEREESTAGKSVYRCAISIRDSRYGMLELQLADPEAFSPYQPFIGNLCFMIALVLEERRQRKLNQEHQVALEQRVLERTLQLSDEKERLAVTLRSIGDGVITTGIDRRVTNLNKVAERLTGWPASEAIGRPLMEVFRIINEETGNPCSDPSEKVIRTGLCVELENHTALVSRNGESLPIADSAAPIKDSRSVTIGVVIVFRDITDRQKMMDLLQRKERLDALGVLAGGIAHDFNNLLGGLFGHLEQAQQKCYEAEVLLHLDKAISVFDRAKALAQQMLTFAKGGAPVKRTGRIETLLKDAASFALSGSSIACTFDFAPDLHLCDFDPHQMSQVVDNLIINAKQAMGPGKGRIVIKACNLRLGEREHLLCPAGDYLCIEINDNGPGIPSEILPRIFDPFFTTKTSGSGLGLATCHSIIQRHNGVIEVNSEQGVGTTFRILLPASHSPVIELSPDAKRRHLGHGRLLVVDDEDYMREIMQLALASMGYEVVAAKDETEALAAWAAYGNEGLRAAFLDLTIKGGAGGGQIAKELRARGASIAIFATSGYSGDPIMAKPTDYGFTASLVKPFTLEDFTSFMNANLSP